MEIPTEVKPEADIKTEVKTEDKAAVVRQRGPSVGTSIIIAGLLIAGAIVYSNGGHSSASAGSGSLVRPVTKEDHYVGNLNAPVKLVEYSDTECPYCKQFHPILEKISADHAATGDLLWVYRPYPLDIHPKSKKETEALECADELGGNDAFWKYLSRTFEITTSNNKLDSAELPKIAAYVGLNVNNFNTCLDSGKYADKVEKDVSEGIVMGIEGTPTSYLLLSDGRTIPILGGRSYEDMQRFIKAALAVK